MVAYSFKKEFADAVETGAKRQTIRAPRQRHARSGEPIQLYTGMRTKACRKLIDPDPVCVSIEPIRIKKPWVGLAGKVLDSYEVCELALADGFANRDEFFEFFAGTPEWFEGVLIRWERR